MKTVLLLLILSICLFAQQEKSVHQSESEYYSRNPGLVGREFFKASANPELEGIESVSHQIYGFHPYWVSDATASGYYYSLLTHVAYFSAEVDNSTSTTGGFSTTRNWATTQVVDYCKKNGVKIHLTITMFSNHDRVLANAAYRTNLVNNIITQVNLRGADGANIDFETISSGQKDNFRLFIAELGSALKANNLELVIELPAVDWSNIFDNTFFTTVNSNIDFYFLMAYDYYYKGSSTAGPISPLTTGTSIRHVMRSITTYNSVGVPLNKLITGFNYYGYEWPVSASTRMASATAEGVTKTFSQVKTAISTIPSGDKFFDDTYKSPWYRYQSGSQWYQTWYDDSLSLSMKYDSIKSRGCAGTGMWALSYDGANTDLWGALKKAFASESNNANTILANFESSSGTFNNIPTFSGSTVGISTSSTSARSLGQAYNGWASLEVVLMDNASSSSNWTVRLLSGGGTPANNTTLSSTGYIGFYLKTSSAPAGAQIAVTIDDGAGGTELSSKKTVINNGQWNLYEWSLQEAGWVSFAAGNGVVNGPTITLDAIMFYALNNSPDWTSLIDDVSFNSTTPLPVELVSFTAKVKSSAVHLQWETATEVNNYGFEVERSNAAETMHASSTQGRTWQKIGFVEGNGNSNSPKSYSFTDRNASAGKYIYRLKQVDTDGAFDYSDEVAVDLGTPAQFSLSQNYPNPFNPSTLVQYAVPVQSVVVLEIYDITGTRVAQPVNALHEPGSYSALFNLTDLNLASGTYIYRLSATDMSGNIMYSAINKMLLLK
ncbi:MAG: T9SS type A sorting domain-containing protein [Ignavibacteriales bacterium]|nr:MAG: T9SS type A sorting domain-containing protein [Ignavibacteriales bacterium]